MGFVALQEALRREVRRRIESGELTGMELAQKTGFTQAHISNFLNRKRGLKLRALDRMLHPRRRRGPRRHRPSTTNQSLLLQSTPASPGPKWGLAAMPRSRVVAATSAFGAKRKA